MRIIVSALSLALGVLALSGCASEPKLEVFGPDPSVTSADATPKLDIRDAAYIEVVDAGYEGGFLGGTRFEIEIPKSGPGTFRVIRDDKHSESRSLSQEQAKELLATLHRNRSVASEDVAYHTLTMDGTMEYFFVETHGGRHFLLSRHNAPDPSFVWLWRQMEAQAFSLLGTFKTHQIKGNKGTSERLQGYLDSVPREIN